MISGLAALARFARTKSQIDRCDLCAVEVGETHDHLVDKDGALRCACRACALLFEGRVVQPRVERIAMIELDVPVSVAWVVRRDGALVVRYPSPAGIAQGTSPPAETPVLAALAPEVEAVLVHRGKDVAYRVSIDECYRLAGVLRARGDVDAWFAGLEARRA